MNFNKFLCWNYLLLFLRVLYKDILSIILRKRKFEPMKKEKREKKKEKRKKKKEKKEERLRSRSP